MEIAEKRWKATDRILRQFQKTYKGMTRQLKEELKDFLNDLNITPSDLNKRITERERYKLNKVIRDNPKALKFNDYLAYRVNTKRRSMSYSDYIELMLLLIYCIHMLATYTALKPTFKAVSEDAYKQAREEMGRDPIIPFAITWDLIEGFLIVKVTGNTLREYLNLLALTDTREAHTMLAQLLNPNIKGQSQLNALVDKQGNRVVNIHDDKESGAIVDLTRQLWHDIYLEPYRQENVQVRFIAEMDNATTKMCKGMDNMLFYTNDWNRYYRYSELDKRDVLYTTFGLVRGENLPPIDNHFHWCRSTVTYMTDDYMLGRPRDGQYSDVTNDYLKVNRVKPAKVIQAYSFIQRKQEFEVDGKHVIATKRSNIEEKEKEVEEWYANTFGGNIYRVPEIKDKRLVNEGVSTETPDLFIDGRRFEIKVPTGSGKRTISKQVQCNKGQADNFIIDVKNLDYTHEEILRQIASIYKNEPWVNIVIVKQGEWYRVFQRNYR